MKRFLLACLAWFAALSAWGQAALMVCLDPGHPSEVGPGTKGKKITELKAAWKVALGVREILLDLGIRVVLTKNSEGQRVTNQARAEVANRAGADLFVRLHCDAATGSGFMTVYPDRQGTIRGVTGPSKAVIQSSAKAAKAFHRAVMAELAGSLGDRGVTTDIHTYVGNRQGALTGSIFSKVPVVLAEMCVLTQSKDDDFMASAKGQEQMARAIASGVVQGLRALGKIAPGKQKTSTRSGGSE